MKLQIILMSMALFVTSSCASMHEWRYAWEPDDTAPFCEVPIWKQVSPERVPGLCSGRDGTAATEDTSCALGCVVISRFSAEQAKHITIDGMSLYQHEAEMHAIRRLKHPS